MKRAHLIFCAGGLAGVLTWAGLSAAQDATSPMNARDMFWSAADLVDKPFTSKTLTKPKKLSKPVAQNNGQPSAPSSSSSSSAASQSAQSNESATEGAPSHVVLTNASANAVPLGLRYTLLKQVAGGKYVEVLPDTTFQVGDHVRVSVMANERSYLYIIEQGSSHAWTPLYPQPKMANLLEPGVNYQFPPKGEFTFDGPAGEDRLFILLTRQPQADLDETILALRHDVAPGKDVSMASNQINDQFVQRMQDDAKARDLIFTMADGDSPTPPESGPKKIEKTEKAAYVVNMDKNADSRVIVDMRLKHQ